MTGNLKIFVFVLKSKTVERLVTAFLEAVGHLFLKIRPVCGPGIMVLVLKALLLQCGFDFLVWAVNTVVLML